MSAVHPDDTDVDPKSLLDWLVKQCICEWCDGTIDDFDCTENYPITPTRKWRNRQIKHGGYTSNHWKFWLICRKCAGMADFSRWVFPVIANMPEHEALSALVQVQPMNAPAGEIFYADYVPVRGRRENGVVIDDDTFRDITAKTFAERFAEQEINQELFTRHHIEIDYKITAAGVERKVNAPSGVFKL